MLCTQCGQEVVSEARFCSQCGQQLRLACQGCDTENPSGSRFCYHCGRSLTEPTDYGAHGGAGGGAGVQTPPQLVGCPRCFANNEPGSVYCFQCGLPFEGKSSSGAPRVSDIPAFLKGRPAGFWVRLLAFLIDRVILSIAVGIIGALFCGFCKSRNRPDASFCTKCGDQLLTSS